MPRPQGESVAVIKPWRTPAGGSARTSADLVPCVDSEGRDRPTATFPELFGTTLPYLFPSKPDRFRMHLPSLPGKISVS